LLGADFVAAAAAAGAVDDGDTFAFVDRAGEIGGGGAFVVRMSDDQEDVGFVSRVGFTKRRCFLRTGAKCQRQV